MGPSRNVITLLRLSPVPRHSRGKKKNPKKIQKRKKVVQRMSGKSILGMLKDGSFISGNAVLVFSTGADFDFFCYVL